MDGFDLRFVIPIIINLLKYQSEALPWDWDAFNVVLNPNQTAWTKVCLHVSMVLLFSFTSITFIPSRRPLPNTALIRFRFGNFFPLMAASLVSSLVFPQVLFWFIYPALLILNYFLGWFQYVNLSTLPIWNLHISSTLTHHEETNSEVPMPQVTIAVSQEDGDSLAEG